MEYSNENLNFFRICHITTNIITRELRTIFKQEWDKRYKVSLGKWEDSSQNGHDFQNQELSSKKKNATLNVMANGNTNKWDCTALFFGILYSASIGKSLSGTAIYSHVDDLRVFRNEVFAHVSEGTISDSDFNTLIGRVEAAFLGLGLPVGDIKAIANQKSFPTEEWRGLRDQLGQEQEKTSALEEELKSSPKAFLGNLPSKPSHVIQERLAEVSMILRRMKELKESNCEEIITIYLFGNPGCGKSQIARMVGETFYKQLSTDDVAFVATLNAEALETLFNSYDSLSRALGCTEFAVGRITTSNDSMEEKLEQFQRLVTPKLKAFSSWLIIVDNVVDLQAVRRFWPTSGSRECGNGQILVTTQDSSTIPGNGSRSHSISLSRGMEPQDAVNLLAKGSQMPNQEKVEDVAQALDYQPLALACAAWYILSVRSHGASNFNWEKYLDKLNRGKEEAMGEIKKKCKSGYTKSMPVAVRMAVGRAVSNDSVLFHTFQFLSICAPGPMPLEVVVDFVENRVQDVDEEEIMSKLMESSLVQISCKTDGKQTLRLHQVLYRDIKSNTGVRIEPGRELEIILSALGPVQSLTIEDSSTSKIFVEHLSAFLSYVISFQRSCFDFFSQVTEATTLADFFERFISCAFMCRKYGEKKIVERCVVHVVVRNFVDGNPTLDDKTMSRLYLFCGRSLVDFSKFEDAIKYLDMSLAIRRQIYDDKHEAVAECLRDLGHANFESCRHVEAMKFYQEALSIFREISGGNNKEVAECLSGIGSVQTHLHCLKDSAQYFQSALTIARKLYDGKHLLVANILHNLGVARLHSDFNDEAERLLEEAIESYLEICGEKREQVAVAITNLGRLHVKCSRFEKARPLLQKAYDIRCDLGNQLRVARSLYFLGYLSEKECKISAAADYYNRAMQTISQFRQHEALPDNHLYVTDLLEALQRIKENLEAQTAATNNK